MNFNIFEKGVAKLWFQKKCKELKMKNILPSLFSFIFTLSFANAYDTIFSIVGPDFATKYAIADHQSILFILKDKYAFGSSSPWLKSFQWAPTQGIPKPFTVITVLIPFHNKITD